MIGRPDSSGSHDRGAPINGPTEAALTPTQTGGVDPGRAQPHVRILVEDRQAAHAGVAVGSRAGASAPDPGDRGASR